jgi:hypothetical protein
LLFTIRMQDYSGNSMCTGVPLVDSRVFTL